MVKPDILVEVGVAKNDRLVLTGGPVELSNEKEQPCIFQCMPPVYHAFGTYHRIKYRTVDSSHIDAIRSALRVAGLG